MPMSLPSLDRAISRLESRNLDLPTLVGLSVATTTRFAGCGYGGFPRGEDRLLAGLCAGEFLADEDTDEEREAAARVQRAVFCLLDIDVDHFREVALLDHGWHNVATT